jgi:hypothetical protein
MHIILLLILLAILAPNLARSVIGGAALAIGGIFLIAVIMALIKG